MTTTILTIACLLIVAGSFVHWWINSDLDQGVADLDRELFGEVPHLLVIVDEHPHVEHRHSLLCTTDRKSRFAVVLAASSEHDIAYLYYLGDIVARCRGHELPTVSAEELGQ